MESGLKQEYTPPLWAFPLRSTISKGKVHEARIPPLPEGVRYISGQEIQGCFQVLEETLPLAAWDEISFYGQVIGFLLGPNLEDLEDLAQQIQWKWKKTKPDLEMSCLPENLVLERKFTKGRPALAWKKAHTIVEKVYTFGPQTTQIPQALRATAFYSEGILFVKAPLPWPGQTRANLAQALSIPLNSVEIIPEPYYQDFENRIWSASYLATQAGVLSWMTKKEIQIEISSWEEYLYGPKRPAYAARYKTALNEEGKILAMDIDLKVDVGAQGFMTEEILDRFLLGALGHYRLRAIKACASAFRTNTLPSSTLGSLGEDMGILTLELHTQDLAQGMNMDPFEWKLKNLPDPGVKSATEQTLKEVLPYGQLLQLINEKADFVRKYTIHQNVREQATAERDMDYMRGIGLSLGFQGNGFMTPSLAKASMEAILERGGVLHLYASLWPRRQVTKKKWKAKISEILEIPPEQIFFHRINPLEKNDSGLDAASRAFEIIGRLLLQCAKAIAKMRFHHALPIKVTKTLKKTPSWDWKGIEFKGVPFHSQSHGVCAAEISYDRRKGIIVPRKIFLAIEAGIVENPTYARAAIKEGVALALKWVFGPGCMIHKGRVLEAGFYPQSPLSPKQPPEVEIHFLPGEKTSLPKGLGTLGASLCAPALILALGQVFHVPIRELPVDIHFIGEVLKNYDQ